jgi:hypothetical protein
MVHEQSGEVLFTAAIGGRGDASNWQYGTRQKKLQYYYVVILA